jgi:signal transduction histidine kinase
MSADAAPRPAEALPEPAPQDGAPGLISEINHALRTPLNSMLGYAQILLRDPLEPLSQVQRERVERIQEAGWQLVKLIDEIVQRARAQPAGEPAERTGGQRKPGDAE